MMRFLRSLYLSPDTPPAGGAGEGGNGGEGGGTPPVDKKPAAPSGPEPVPYDVFKATNDRLKAAEARASAAESKAAGFEGWHSPDALKAAVEEEAGRGKSALMLADNKVLPKYRDYMLTRLAAAKPDDPATWLTSLAQSEPAFFHDQAPAGGAPSGTTTPPPTNTPEGGVKTKPPGTGRPVTVKDLDAMTPEEYVKFRDGGGLKTLLGNSAG